MSVAFNIYTVRPLLPGGTGQIQTAFVGNDVERMVVKLGASAAASWDDASMKTVEITLGETPGDGSLCIATFTQALAAENVVASWFYKLSTGWESGPVVSGIDLRCKYSAAFPWLKGTIIDLLRQGAVDNPPELPDGRVFQIRSAFPRDSHALPVMSVQVTAMPTGIQFVGDAGDDNSQLYGKTVTQGRGYNVTVDMVAWTDQPEEREILAPWLGGVCLSLMETMPYFGAHDPTFTINESEDFETLKVPIFLVTGTINFSAFSKLSFPMPTNYGRIQLVQEVS